MRTLIYKRTHKGDPDIHGRFGIHNCMRRVRGYDFDAVIGVGGIGAEPRAAGIAGKINWVGVGARKVPGPYKHPIVTFDRFILFEQKGKSLAAVAETLAKRMYKDPGPRVLLSYNLPDNEQKEVEKILRMATRKPRPGPSLANRSDDCPPSRCKCPAKRKVRPKT